MKGMAKQQLIKQSMIWIVLMPMLSFYPLGLFAQKMDTSFTLYSAYHKISRQHPEAVWFDNVKIPDDVRQHEFVYDSTLATPLSVIVIAPKSEQASLVPVLIIHGGGWASGNPAMHTSLAVLLAQKGYTVFLPEYRLSGTAIYPAAAIDLLHLIRWMDLHTSALNIHMPHLVYAGFSAGGTLASLIAQPGFQQQYASELSGRIYPGMALIDLDGTLSFVHPESTEGDDSKRISAATRWLGCPRKQCPQVWEQASPLFYTGADAPPTLFINSSVSGMHAGRNDYVSRLQQSGIVTRVIEWPDAPHTFCLFHPWLNAVSYEVARFIGDVKPLN